MSAASNTVTRLERLLTTAQVAAIFRVDVATISRLAAAGHIEGKRTDLGWRFRESVVREATKRGIPS